MYLDAAALIKYMLRLWMSTLWYHVDTNILNMRWYLFFCSTFGTKAAVCPEGGSLSDMFCSFSFPAVWTPCGTLLPLTGQGQYYTETEILTDFTHTPKT